MFSISSVSPISPNFSSFCCFDTVSTSLSVTGMADSNNDVFRMLSAEDKLDGDSNYPLWAYMMQHVLVSRGVWNIVQVLDIRPSSIDAGFVEDVAGSSSSTSAVVLPVVGQAHWDGKDA